MDTQDIKAKELIDILKRNKQTIATMESCTGGLLASEITNIEESSSIFSLGLISYSNKTKMIFGVDEKVIKTYSVYSIQTAQEMAKIVALTASSTWGIGITGQLGNIDIHNTNAIPNRVFYSIYNKPNNKYYSYYINLHVKDTRIEKKYCIVNQVIEKIKEIIIDEQ